MVDHSFLQAIYLISSGRRSSAQWHLVDYLTLSFRRSSQTLFAGIQRQPFISPSFVLDGVLASIFRPLRPLNELHSDPLHLRFSPTPKSPFLASSCSASLLPPVSSTSCKALHSFSKTSGKRFSTSVVQSAFCRYFVGLGLLTRKGIYILTKFHLLECPSEKLYPRLSDLAIPTTVGLSE